MTVGRTYRVWPRVAGSNAALLLYMIVPFALLVAGAELAMGQSLVHGPNVLLGWIFALTFALGLSWIFLPFVEQQLNIGADGLRIRRGRRSETVRFAELASLEVREAELWTRAAGEDAAPRIVTYLEPCVVLRIADFLARNSSRSKRPGPDNYDPKIKATLALVDAWEAYKTRAADAASAEVRLRVATSEGDYRSAEIGESDLARVVADPAADIAIRVRAAKSLVQMSRAAGVRIAHETVEATVDPTLQHELDALIDDATGVKASTRASH